MLPVVDALVDAAADEQRAEQGEDGVEDDEHEPERPATAATAGRTRAPGTARGPRRRPRRRRRRASSSAGGSSVERGEQLGGGGQRGAEVAAAAGANRGAAATVAVATGAPSSSTATHAEAVTDPARRRGRRPRPRPRPRTAAPARRLVAARSLVVLVEIGDDVGAGEQVAVARRSTTSSSSWVPSVDDPAVVDHDDAVGEPQGRAAVGDEDRGAVGHERAQRVVDGLLGRGVDGRGGVVEHEDARVGDDGPGQGDALALAARQREAALADDGVVAVGQLVDEPLGAGRHGRGRGPRRRWRRGGRRRCSTRTVSENRNASSNTTPTWRRSESSVTSRTSMPSMVTRAGGHVVEAGQQRGDGGLARAARRRRARRPRRRPTCRSKSSSTGWLAGVAEAHVVEAHLAAGRAARSTASGVSCTRALASSMSRIRSAPARACWPMANSAGEHPHRRDELHEVGGEGQERAERDVAVDGQPAAEGQHRHLGERRDRLQRRR